MALIVDDGQWRGHMTEAIAEALSPDVFPSSNPRVGCVIVDASGTVVGRGHHRGAGTPHAEVVALAAAGDLARGATAVVTLEPCRHRGRTGPCVDALIEAGVSRVVFAQSDPGADEGGGGEALRTAGIDVLSGVGIGEAAHANRAWTHWQATGRPYLTLKCAQSLDGRVASVGGGPTRITGDEARAHAHAFRSTVDAIVVGTGTILADDPQLTARNPDGSLMARQPIRVVVGRTELPTGARVLDGASETVLVRSQDPADLVSALLRADAQHALIEGGPILAAALLDADLVEEVMWFVAPTLLGAGPVALPELATPRDVTVRTVSILGEDVLVEGDVVHVHRHR